MQIEFNRAWAVQPPIESVSITLSVQEAKDLKELCGSLSHTLVRDLLRCGEDKAGRIRGLIGDIYEELYRGLI